mgnify:CR=1 FL=1
MPRRRSVLAALSAAWFAGCTVDSGDGPATRPDESTSVSTPSARSRHWYTHARRTGNRTLAGEGDIRDTDPVTFAPAGSPQWLVAHPAEGGSQWTVVTGDGRASRWRVRDGSARRVAEYDPLPAETQPVVATGDGAPRPLRPPGDMAPRTSPLVAPGDDERPPKLLYVGTDGALVVAGERRTRLAVDALLDGRLAALGDGRYVLFAAPTDRYRHGALGDTTEGSSLVAVDATVPEVVWETSVDPQVFEGLQGLVADLDGDGEPEIVTTVADTADGARIAVFGADGDRLATGPVYGPGWRHQLAVAPFGPDDRPELAVVRKPHVDRVVEFYRLDGGSLDVVATLSGFSTHTYGSRVLDGALAADFDADGRTELLVPTSDRETLAAVQRTADGAEVAWEAPLDSRITSNLTGITLSDGVATGVGTDDGVSVWQT